MNQADAVKAHKLSQGMVDALSLAAFREHATGNGEAGYVIHDMHPRTRKALHDRGLMYGHYYLTRKGIEVLATLAGNTVDTRGYVWEGDKLLVAPYVETYADDVTVTDMPTAPEFDAPGAAECFFGCGSAVVAVFVDYVGRTEGLCATHRDRVEGETYSVPATPENGSQDVQEDDSMTEEFTPMDRTGDGITSVMTVAVIQNTPGMAGVTHYHAPGCRDIQREMRKYGQRPSDAFENGFDTVAEILEFEFGDIASDNAESNTPEWWSEIFYNATGDAHGGVKIMPCLDIPNGETSDGSPIIRDGHFYRAGFKRSQESQDAARKTIAEHNVNTCDERECVTCWAKFTSECQENHTGNTVCKACESVSIEYDESARKFPCVMVGGVIIHKGECAQAHGVNGPVCSLESDDETEDAGFVETESVDDYSTVSALTTGAGFHTVDDSRNATPEAPVTTGTTTHTLDTDGSEWVRFDHVLSVGDVVKVVGSQGVYEIHCLIPGLPVVYVLGTTGEPFPVPASKVYAL